MKKSKYILFLITIFLFGCKPLKHKYSSYNKYVSAYYEENSKNPIILYDKYKGKAIDTLKVLKRESAQCYYKFTISKSKNRWFKLKEINIHPCNTNAINKNEGSWIKIENLIISTSDCVDSEDCIKVKFYESPTKSSKVLYSTSKYIETNLIEVKGNWAKVIYLNGKTKIIGWLPRNRQCSHPWTNCIFH